MKYEEMSDRQIEFKVWINGDDKGSKRTYKDNGKVLISCDEYGNQRYEDVPKYCNNPSDAWPIIIANNISINHGKTLVNDEWFDKWFVGAGTPEAQERTTDGSKVLRAAMICFLKMKGS
ncbi:NinX [Vibrio phage 1.067.O._10N.261.52.C9]|nr:NinX [Vibrio phage 1.067.O._10N.261.52.C9]